MWQPGQVEVHSHLGKLSPKYTELMSHNLSMRGVFRININMLCLSNYSAVLLCYTGLCYFMTQLHREFLAQRLICIFNLIIITYLLGRDWSQYPEHMYYVILWCHCCLTINRLRWISIASLMVIFKFCNHIFEIWVTYFPHELSLYVVPSSSIYWLFYMTIPCIAAYELGHLFCLYKCCHSFFFVTSMLMTTAHDMSQEEKMTCLESTGQFP